MKRIFSSTIWVLTIFVFFVSVSSAQLPEEVGPSGINPELAGYAKCPAPTTIEVFFVTYARDNGSSGTATVISVTNLGTKIATVTCQFFYGYGASQAGSNATLTLNPGETGECATRDTDPLEIFDINASADTPSFEGKARICSNLASIAADARLSSTVGGLYGIKLVKSNSQKGD